MFIPEEFQDDRSAAIDALMAALHTSAPKKDSDGLGVTITDIMVGNTITVELEVVTRDIDEAMFTFSEHSAIELREDEEVAAEVAESIFDQIESGLLDDPLVGYMDDED